VSHRLRQRAVALGLISLELLVIGHMAFERHTVSHDGGVIELHGAFELHGHDEPSLCERGAGAADFTADLLCQLAPERTVSSGGASLSAPGSTPFTLEYPNWRVSAFGRLWLTAPKASPPARG
jgi:hypothetical protein